MGLAFTLRNKKYFKRLGTSVFLSSDVVLVGPELISIGDNSTVGNGCTLTVWRTDKANGAAPYLKIGDNTSIGEYAHITAANGITIGNHVLLGKHITISDNNHGDNSLAQTDTPPTLRPLVSKGPIVIEDNVWIGSKATILAGVIVGRGAVVAANSVVTSNVPAASIIAGRPAKVVKLLE